MSVRPAAPPARPAVERALQEQLSKLSAAEAKGGPAAQAAKAQFRAWVAKNRPTLTPAAMAQIRKSHSAAELTGIAAPPPNESTFKLTHKRFAHEPLLAKVASGELGSIPPAKVQQALLDLGYSIRTSNPDDKVIANDEKYALTCFQRDHKLPTTGRLDAATLKVLDQVAPPPGKEARLAPRYDEMFKDGVFDVTVGLGYDELNKDREVRAGVLKGLSERGFKPLDVSSMSDAQLVKQGLDPKQIDRQGSYFIKPFNHQGKQVHALVKVVDRDSAAPKSSYSKGMNQSDLVLYAGHGRAGLGPDFDDSDSMRENYIIGANAEGHANKSLTPTSDAEALGLAAGRGNDLEKAQMKKGYQMVVYSGCNTESYLDELRALPHGKDSSNLNVVVSEAMVSWSEQVATTLAMLDGTMKAESLPALKERMAKANFSPFVWEGFASNRRPEE
jgi:hypothetical protein